MEAHQGGFFCLLGEQGTELVYTLVTPTLPEWFMSKEAVFTMKLEPELRDAFMAEAQASHRPASQVVRELMREFVDRQR